MTNYKLHEDCKILSKKIYPDNRQQHSNGWTYKETLSNHRNGFYSEIYTKGDRAILVMRGTETHSGKKEAIKDGYSDLQMDLQLLPRQMKDAEKAYLSAVRKYGKENVILTGHSLGGSEAQILGAKYGVETVTFAAYGTKYLSGMEINYTDNITNYGNAQDGVYVMNIDGQLGKTVILNAIGFENGTFKEEYKIHDPRTPHDIDNFGDLSKGIEYNKEVFEDEYTPLFKMGIEYNDYNYDLDEIFDTKNRVLYRGEINPDDLEVGTPLFDLYIDNMIDKNSMPTKKEVDKRTRIGELIYVEDYTRSDGTKVSGYYRAYPRK